MPSIRTKHWANHILWDWQTLAVTSHWIIWPTECMHTQYMQTHSTMSLPNRQSLCAQNILLQITVAVGACPWLSSSNRKNTICSSACRQHQKMQKPTARTLTSIHTTGPWHCVCACNCVACILYIRHTYWDHGTVTNSTYTALTHANDYRWCTTKRKWRKAPRNSLELSSRTEIEQLFKHFDGYSIIYMELTAQKEKANRGKDKRPRSNLGPTL